MNVIALIIAILAALCFLAAYVRSRGNLTGEMRGSLTDLGLFFLTTAWIVQLIASSHFVNW